jgi:hypothetical protein
MVPFLAHALDHDGGCTASEAPYVVGARTKVCMTCCLCKQGGTTGTLVGVASGHALGMAQEEIAGQAVKQMATSKQSDSAFVRKMKHTVAENLTKAVREAEIPPIA